MDLPETTRTNGLTAYFLNPLTGPFLDHLDSEWLTQHLLPPNTRTANFVPRPDAHQYLRPWSAEDDAALGFGSTEAPPEAPTGSAWQ